MTDFIPPKMVTRPALRDPEWWTSIAVDLASLNVPRLAVDLGKFLKTKEVNVHKELALLYNESFIRCLNSYKQDLLEFKPIKHEITDEEILTFDPKFPMAFVYFQKLLSELIDKSKSEYDDNTETLIYNIRENFGKYFEEIRKWDSDKYSSVNKFIDMLNEDLDTIEGKMIRHTRSILERVGFEPLPIDTSITLWEIYITPSARYWDDVTENKNEPETCLEVPNLIEAMLDVIDKSPSPIILHGQPGHGKTSTVSMFVHAVINYDIANEYPKPFNILMYEFKDLGRLDLPELLILQRVTPFITDETFFIGKRTIMILDGMDERQVIDNDDIYLKDFIRNLFNLSVRLNKHENTKFNLILTGRSQFVKFIQHTFVHRYHQYEIIDFTPTQVSKWLYKYSNTKKIVPALNYNKFSEMKISELVHQPILLTICSLLLSDPKGKQLIEELDNRRLTRGMIFEKIIKFTYEKKWQIQPNRSALPDEYSYNRLLRIVSFVLYKKRLEIIKIGELVDELKNHNNLYNLDIVKLRESIEPILKNLAISFFFKGFEENAFSFIHKSINDYLVSEAILDLLVESTAIYDPQRIDKTCDKFAEDIYNVLGVDILSPEAHRGLIRDIVEIRRNDANKLFQPLVSFFQLAQSHTYLTKHGVDQNENPLITDANVLYGLMEVIIAIFLSFETSKRKEYYKDGCLKIFDDRYQFYKLLSLMEASHVYFYRFDLPYINLENSFVGNTDLTLVNLRNSNLAGSDFQNCVFKRANLSSSLMNYCRVIFTTFQSARLDNAISEGAIIFNTDFRGANMRNINLKSSTMNFVDFNKSDLTNADLSLCKITNTNMDSAKLVNAKLFNADIRNSYLAYVDLRKARLSEISMSEVILNNAYLLDADLSNSSLTNINLTNANLYNADLTNAELINTNLENAFLKNSRLINATLIGVKFNNADFTNANLTGTVLRNVDLRYTRGLTREQISKAYVHHTTLTPHRLN